MLRNRTWAIIGPRCLMTCELVQSQLPRVSPIGTQLGYMIHYWVFRDLHFFFSALQFSAPEHVNGLRKRTSFFFCDGPTCGQTVDKRGTPSKSRGHGGQISETRISCAVCSAFPSQILEQNAQDFLLGHCGIVLQTSEICIYYYPTVI